MTYKNITKAIFIDRPNRFIARVSVNGIVRTAHVKKTGRCKELLIPGAEVWLTASDNPLRKTAYDLVAVRKSTGILFNIDSQAPNKVAYEWLKKQHFELLAKPVQEIFDNLEAGYANRQDDDDYDWVILPVVNFNAYYGATTFEKKYLPILPEKIFVRETIHGLCRFKVML